MASFGAAAGPTLAAAQTPESPPRIEPYPGAKKCKGDVDAGVIGFDIRVKRVSCAAAKKKVRTFAKNSMTGRSPIRAVPGWRCRQVGTYYEGAYYRCNRGGKSFQFGLGV